jgi:hypothetical protein
LLLKIRTVLSITHSITKLMAVVRKVFSLARPRSPQSNIRRLEIIKRAAWFPQAPLAPSMRAAKALASVPSMPPEQIQEGHRATMPSKMLT